MKAITILQPWASLIACGAKKIETRSWATKYRGPIAIHAGSRFDRKLWNLSLEDPIRSVLDNAGYGNRNDLPVGAVIAIADLVDCVEINESHLYYLNLNQNNGDSNEFAFGDYQIGRYAWILDNVKPITPVPVKGQQRIWEWDGKGK